MDFNKSYEEQIEDLYKEFEYKKRQGMDPDKNIYKWRKIFLQHAIKIRDKKHD